MKFALAFALLACAPALHAQTCTAQIEGGKRIESARHTLAYRTDPVKVVVGKPFAVDLAICPRESGARIEEVRVDGHMPEHRHGMNYKASVKAQAEPGRYRAEGLIFHMPGKWEFLFDLRDAKGMERLKQEFALK
jgi:hypothetical protein